MSCWNSWIRNLTGHLSLIVQVARIIGVTDEQKRLMGVGSGLELVTLPHGHQLRQDLLERYTQPAHYFKNQSNVTLCQSSLEVLVYLVAVHRNCKRISFYLFVSLFGVFCTSFFFNSLVTTKFVSPQLYLLGLWLGESQCSEMKNVPYQLLHSIFCPLRRL